MPAQVLELKPAFSFALVLKRARTFKVPAWPMAALVILGGVYGYVSGRQNPVHHYVPYVGYPLVLDTTTGKACYSSVPRPSDLAAALAVPVSADSNGATGEPAATPGPAIPICGK